MVLFLLIVLITEIVYAEVSISPSLKFARALDSGPIASKVSTSDPHRRPVTLRFSEPPTGSTIDFLESLGVVFTRTNGRILHSAHIYPARIDPDNLESILVVPGLERIEDTFHPSATSTLDISNAQVQASLVWNSAPNQQALLGNGVTVVDVDTGVDYYHPAFFKADGGTFSWIDTNGNGIYDSGTDGVDLNGNGRLDSGEILRFYDAPCKDTLSLLPRTSGVFDTDFDWLYNDSNLNAKRDYGPNTGFTEISPCYGERIFLVKDTNGNNRLDPGELLTGLGSSKINTKLRSDE